MEVMYTWLGLRPEGTCELHEEVVRMSKVPIPAILSSLSLPVPRTSWGVPYKQLTEEKKTRSGLQMALQNMQTPPKGGQLQYYNLWLGYPLRTAVKANLSIGQDCGQWTCLFTLPGRRKRQTCGYILIDGLWPTVWLHGQGLGSNMTGKLVKIKFGEEICR